MSERTAADVAADYLRNFLGKAGPELINTEPIRTLLDAYDTLTDTDHASKVLALDAEIIRLNRELDGAKKLTDDIDEQRRHYLSIVTRQRGELERTEHWLEKFKSATAHQTIRVLEMDRLADSLRRERDGLLVKLNEMQGQSMIEEGPQVDWESTPRPNAGAFDGFTNGPQNEAARGDGKEES